ncbi:ABZJ_00895 family protein [Roseovarius aestuariivivens]|uniref:ABZJ_00895 family protein n=1 Tax=Roseovarius aestuariivivens TaxID=1888910 RepID=UPI0010812F15|nr:ABZJ_00895 family protein [Roseovarius aestuariivivens]
MVWLRYAFVFLAVAVGVAQVVLWLDRDPGLSFGGALQLMVPAMIAALIEGGQLAKRERARPSSARAWRFAGVAAGIATLLNLALAFAGPQVAPEFAKLAIAPVDGRQFWLLLAIYAGGYFIVNRFFYGLGAGNTISRLKAHEERERG